MPRVSEGPRSTYERALEEFLTAGGEDQLMHAYTIGRETIAEGLAALVALHGGAMRRLARADLSREALVEVVDRSTRFLEEAIAPFEMTVRGFQETTERLRAANTELRRADEMKDQFIAQMSHELRTPLNSILGFSELLLDGTAGALDDRQRRYVGNVHSSGKHLLGLVNDLLDLSKIRAGRLEVNQGVVDVRQIIELAMAQVRPLADVKRLEMAAEFGFEASIPGDPVRLSQVLLNLLSNAIKFTPAGGTVTVSTGRLDGRIAIRVRDTGVGIAADEQARVFEEFVQLEAGRAEGREGSGLGLALSSRLVELMGGRITVVSAVGEGSTFSVELPIVRAAH